MARKKLKQRIADVLEAHQAELNQRLKERESNFPMVCTEEMMRKAKAAATAEKKAIRADPMRLLRQTGAAGVTNSGRA